MAKECVATREVNEIQNFVRGAMVLQNYNWLREKASEAGCRIIPLKGIDLLQTIYRDTYARPVRDIDIWVDGAESCRRLVEHLCQEDYRLEFPFSMTPENLRSKRKVSLISCSLGKVNVDIHIAFVTKKFFSHTIGTFNEDAARRCGESSMDPVDRWLFLAQHAAFHNFSDPKWTRDLTSLYDDFDSEALDMLESRAAEYGFRRVWLAALTSIGRSDRISGGRLRFGERCLLRFLSNSRKPFTRNIRDRILTAYWEFPFIARGKDRVRMTASLLFPDAGTLANIYRVNNRAMLALYYPLNILINSVMGSAHVVLYGLRICRR